MYSDYHFTPEGKELTEEEWEKLKWDYLPSTADRDYIRNLMCPVLEPGKIANWIARPAKGINGKLFDFEYVRKEE